MRVLCGVVNHSSAQSGLKMKYLSIAFQVEIIGR